MKTGGEGEMLSPASGRLEPPGAGRGGQGRLLDASRAGGGPAGTSAWAPGLGSGARLTLRCCPPPGFGDLTAASEMSATQSGPG